MSEAGHDKLLRSLLSSMGLLDAFAFRGDIIPRGMFQGHFSNVQRGIWESLITNQSLSQSTDRQRHCANLLNIVQASFKVKQNEGTDLFDVDGPIPAIVDPDAVRHYFSGRHDDALGFLAALVPGPVEFNDWRYSVFSFYLNYRMDLNDKSHVKKSLKHAIESYDTIIDKFNRKYSDVDSEFERIKNVYTNKIKLSKANEYFENKRKSHFRSAFSAAILLLILLFGAVAFFILYVYPVVSVLSREASQNGVYLYGAMIGAVAFFYGWIARIFSRIFQTNMSLWSDAKQRAVLISVFLSLQNEGGIQADEKERVIILNALFRPLDSKEDDIAQPSILDIIQKSKP